MFNRQLAQKLLRKENLVVPILFKPIQFRVINKLFRGEKLSENEKRYLRGKIKKKLQALNELTLDETHDEFTNLLNNISSYYITGLDALKHNGYGWYYEPKFIEIINTKIEGIMNFGSTKIRFIRVKSVKNSKISVDKETGIKYATNEQIIKDTKFTKNEFTKLVWQQMLKRYGEVFAQNKENKMEKESKIDYSKYGV
ncbi:hypothetical protein HZA97_05330 [Candidatus Woesearchaeota archaeon]|nr:hypothetical protein [Candidatus Woesearchaeota archaeon]